VPFLRPLSDGRVRFVLSRIKGSDDIS